MTQKNPPKPLLRNPSEYNVIRKILLDCFAHPSRYALTCTLLEGEAEGAVATVATVAGQLLGDDGLSGSSKFLVAADEVVDAQIINIGIVSDALT